MDEIVNWGAGRGMGMDRAARNMWEKGSQEGQIGGRWRGVQKRQVHAKQCWSLCLSG